MKTLTACIALFLISFCGMAWAADEKPADDKDAAVAAPAKTMNMCAMCHVLSETPGKCPKCGMEMTKCHVLAVKDGTALCCTCGPECTCKPAGDDMTKCTCGKDIVKVSVKGKYVCGCAPECKCTKISDTPGKCGCNMDMKKVE